MSIRKSVIDSNRQKKAWIKQCWDYHSKSISDFHVAVDWDAWDQEWCNCWACGDQKPLQKCHLTPKALGGADDLSNTIPLCRRCHDLAPDVLDPQVMLDWVAEQSYSSFVLNLEEGRRVVHRVGSWGRQLPTLLACLETVDALNIDQNLLYKCMHEAKKQICYHWGQHGQGVFTKDSTRQWFLEESFRLYSEKLSNSAAKV